MWKFREQLSDLANLYRPTTLKPASSTLTWKYAERCLAMQQCQDPEIAYRLLVEATEHPGKTTIAAMRANSLLVGEKFGRGKEFLFLGSDFETGKLLLLKFPGVDWESEVKACEDLKLDSLSLESPEALVPTAVRTFVVRPEGNVPSDKDEPKELTNEPTTSDAANGQPANQPADNNEGANNGGGNENNGVVNKNDENNDNDDNAAKRRDIKVLVMPLLAATVGELTPLKPEALLGQAKRLVCVNYIHSKGFVHMDVQAANVLVSHTGQWYLANLASCVAVDSPVRFVPRQCHWQYFHSGTTRAEFRFDWGMLAVLLAIQARLGCATTSLLESDVKSSMLTTALGIAFDKVESTIIALPCAALRELLLKVLRYEEDILKL